MSAAAALAGPLLRAFQRRRERHSPSETSKNGLHNAQGPVPSCVACAAGELDMVADEQCGNATATKVTKQFCEASSASSANPCWEQADCCREQAAYASDSVPLLDAWTHSLTRVVGPGLWVLLCWLGRSSNQQTFAICCAGMAGLTAAIAPARHEAPAHQCQQRRFDDVRRRAAFASTAASLLVLAAFSWSIEVMVHKALQLAFLLACCVALVAFFITYVRWSKSREDSRSYAEAVRRRETHPSGMSCQHNCGIHWDVVAACLTDDWEDLAVLRCLSTEVRRAADRAVLLHGIQGWIHWGPKPDPAEQILVSLPEVLMLPLSCCSRRRRKRSTMWLNTWGQGAPWSFTGGNGKNSPPWALSVPLRPGQLVQEDFSLGTNKGSLLKISAIPNIGLAEAGADQVDVPDIATLEEPSPLPQAPEAESQLRVATGRVHSMTLCLLLPVARPGTPLRYCRVGPVPIKARNRVPCHWLSTASSSVLWVPTGVRGSAAPKSGLNLGTVQHDSDGRLISLHIQVAALRRLHAVGNS
mmetsp:Transcript_11200/g.20418  ORF Transcript_11200/g.20418 Transcript_11200/m.20418 type:complete len:528 (+) Transcript_11200:160-1743(+)